jgi:hypothetical protein
LLGSALSNFVQTQATIPSLVRAFQSFPGKIEKYQDANLPVTLVNYNSCAWGTSAITLGI